MPDQASLQIRKFADVFHTYVGNVSSINLGPNSEYYRKILYFSILEALSKARYPTDRAGKAFSKFLVNYCQWAEGDKISLPHVVATLDRTADPLFKKLRECAYSKLKERGSGGLVGIDQDLDRHIVQKMWPKVRDSNELKVREVNIQLNDLQHKNLIYAIAANYPTNRVSLPLASRMALNSAHTMSPFRTPAPQKLNGTLFIRPDFWPPPAGPESNA